MSSLRVPFNGDPPFNKAGERDRPDKRKDADEQNHFKKGRTLQKDRNNRHPGNEINAKGVKGLDPVCSCRPFYKPCNNRNNGKD